MRIAPLADVKARLSAYVEECEASGPVVITRNGRAVALLLAPADEEDLARLLLGRSPRFQALLDKSRQSIRAGKGLLRDEFWKAAKARARNEPDVASVRNGEARRPRADSRPSQRKPKKR